MTIDDLEKLASSFEQSCRKKTEALMELVSQTVGMMGIERQRFYQAIAELLREGNPNDQPTIVPPVQPPGPTPTSIS